MSARVIRAGRTLTVAMAEVFGVADDDTRTPVATMLSTVIARPRAESR